MYDEENKEYIDFINSWGPMILGHANPEVIKTVQEVEERLEHISESITVSIIGCIVNGPGEAKETDIGLTGGGKGNHQIYVNGITDHIIRNQNVADYIVNFVQNKIEQRKSI